MPTRATEVRSTVTIAIRRYESGTQKFSAYATGVTIAPQLSPAAASLWGELTDPKKPDANADRTVEHALTGVAITPVPRKPDAVSDVPLLELIYGDSGSTGFRLQAPTPDTRYVVTGDPQGASLTITVSGAHSASLPNTGYVLSALVDPWVSDQRTATLDELTALGFDTPTSASASVKLLAETALTDWPRAALIGAPA